MNTGNGQHDDLWELLEALGEERITAEESARLERAVLSDRKARRLYLEYIALHGALYWDAAMGADPSMDSNIKPSPAAANAAPPITNGPSQPDRLRRRLRTAVIVAACLAVIVGFVVQRQFLRDPEVPIVADRQEPLPEQGPRHNPADPRSTVAAGNSPGVTDSVVVAPRPDLHATGNDSGKKLAGAPPAPSEKPESARDGGPVPAPIPRAGGSSDAIVAFIDEEIRRGWETAGIEPSPVADDAEWLRRAYLDIVGHIPSPAAVESFLEDDRPDKRAALVDRLLDDPDYVRNWTTVWTNLLVGRSSERDVNRAALRKFLRESFARNRPWKDVVFELVAAEGSRDENGAANFLLAHLNNEAVPATAITARLFLGIQVHCVQCHDHPTNDWKQDRFWELNSFFQQTARLERRQHDPRTGRPVVEAALASREVGGPTFYETRSQLMRVAYPRFNGETVDPSPEVNRRRELARLMTEGEEPLVARAMVNRMWGHFFGHGFTRPVDDMGPHNPPTHPELLDRLTREFVASGYDLKRLIRWITGTRAYRLTSRFGPANADDDPEIGNLPLFSRVYVKPMTAEQLYDSLLVATRAHHAGQSNWADVEQQRQQWLQQFVIAHQTDENDEAVTFDGSIPQALLLMNSPLVRQALSPRAGTFLHEVLSERESDFDGKLRRLALAAVSRPPTPNELAAFKRLLRQRPPRSQDRQAVQLEVLQDAFWAYLNSNEFILVH